MVEVLRMPHWCAVSMTSHHCAVLSLLRESTWRTLSSSISAAVPGKRVEPVVFQHQQIFADRHAGQLDAVNHLHRREGVRVHPGRGGLHRAQDVAIVQRRQIARQAALDADFGRAPAIRPRGTCAPISSSERK